MDGRTDGWMDGITDMYMWVCRCVSTRPIRTHAVATFSPEWPRRLLACGPRQPGLLRSTQQPKAVADAISHVVRS